MADENKKFKIELPAGLRMFERPFSVQADLNAFIPATDDDKREADRMRESTTFFKDGLRRFRKNKVAMVCMCIVILIVLSCILLPMSWPYSYEQQLGVTPGKPVDASCNNLAPFEYGKTELARKEAGEKVFPHLFGTDTHGRDYFIRVVYGTRISLAVGFFASIIVLIIGLIYGSVSGYLGGKVDLVMMRIVDIIYSLPDMLVIILLSVVLKTRLNNAIQGTIFETIGSNVLSMFIVFGMLYWVGMARLVRGQILSLKKEEYILSAQLVGSRASRIIRKHLIPNCMGVVFISTALQIPSAIFTESYLSFLGLGVSAPMPSLGSLASDALNGYVSYPYRLLLPALMIFLIVLSLNLMGDGLRDAFDPKLKS